MRTTFYLILLLPLLQLITACGQKGGIYIPQDPSPAGAVGPAARTGEPLLESSSPGTSEAAQTAAPMSLPDDEGTEE